jgi:SAM-dependent methyltransferase
MTTKTKKDIQAFYDKTGWSQVGEGRYQNATYEDLRAVAQEYTHNTHLRINRYIAPEGKYLLDAGSGPVQYPEYLTYSEGYDYRVCVDISRTALVEARSRLKERGLYVIADIANLPFRQDAFDGIVSLHAIHHLHVDEHPKAYRELYRSLAPERTAAVVNGWGRSWFFRTIHTPWRMRSTVRRWWRRIRTGQKKKVAVPPEITFVDKYDANWLKKNVGKDVPFKIFVWRSVTSITTRLYFHSWFGGRFWLKLLYNLEERFPRWFGEHGSYPVIFIEKE